MIEDPVLLGNLVLNHIVSGNLTSADLDDMDSVRTVYGNSFDVEHNGDLVSLGEARVIKIDYQMGNFIIQGIDTVLIPEE